MRKKMYIYLLVLLILSTNIGFGNGDSKAKAEKVGHAKHNTKTVAKLSSDRIKRSLYDDDDRMPWPQKGKKLTAAHQKSLVARQKNDEDDNDKLPMHFGNNIMKETPFWGNRGRRDSSSSEYSVVDHPIQEYNHKYCKNCYTADTSLDRYNSKVKERREELPFWGNRGRRSSEETEEPFWGNRGRRQDSQDEPFWGNRGRRQDDAPFWGNIGRRDDEPFWGTRGRREDEPFWGNRGRREEEPFWGNRGRREEEPFWGNRGRRDDTPFWGNRGRRDQTEPFWSSRGRRQESEPFWGNRGRREEGEPFWGNRGRRKHDLKETILEAINDVQDDIENLSRLRRSNIQSSFWANRARDSKLKNLFNGPVRLRSQQFPNFLKNEEYGEISKSGEPGTVHDNRMYAEEPHYIIVDRSSRSSAEDDPYFISRGKKYFLDISKAARDRRGAIEEIVKSVRNDPYYIARGKKDSENVKVENSTTMRHKLFKAKDLICSTIELILIKNEGNKSKREASDNDRDRRTILKKLAAQLQMDPYFVSRGKKSGEEVPADDNLEDFINDVASKCN